VAAIMLQLVLVCDPCDIVQKEAMVFAGGTRRFSPV
jgi:hypothetical protein